MSVEVNDGGASFEAGVPKELFTTVIMSGAGAGNGGVPFSTFDVSPDGQRFQITRVRTESTGAVEAPAAVTVVLNWVQALNAPSPHR
jgi:hypothetical protein